MDQPGDLAPPNGQAPDGIEPVWLEKSTEVLDTGKPTYFEARLGALECRLAVAASRMGNADRMTALGRMGRSCHPTSHIPQPTACIPQPAS